MYQTKRKTYLLQINPDIVTNLALSDNDGGITGNRGKNLSMVYVVSK